MDNKNTGRDIEVHNFKVDYRIIIIKKHGTGTKIDYLINRLEDPDITPCNYSHLSFDKEASSINNAAKLDIHRD